MELVPYDGFANCQIWRNSIDKNLVKIASLVKNFADSTTFSFVTSHMPGKHQFLGIRKLFWFPRLVSFESAFNFSQGNIYLMTKGCCRFFGYTSHKKFSQFTKVELQHSPKQRAAQFGRMLHGFLSTRERNVRVWQSFS